MIYYREDINEKITRIAEEGEIIFPDEYLWLNEENTKEYLSRLQDMRKGEIINVVMQAFLEHLREVKEPCESWMEDIPYYMEIRAAFTLRTFDGISDELYNELQNQINENSAQSLSRGKSPSVILDDWDE